MNAPTPPPGDGADRRDAPVEDGEDEAGGRDGSGSEVTGRPTTPKPVRAGLSGPAAVEVSAAEVVAREGGERSLEVDGETWTVRLRGRARGHVSQGMADLMLLGFHRPGQDEPTRESLVPGRNLEAMGADELRAAFQRSRPARDPFESSELFPGTRRKRNRGR